MKKLLVLLCCIGLLYGCNDGDIKVESFDFGTAAPQACESGNANFFLFKYSGNEALILQLPETNFINKETPDGSPKTVTITGAVKVIYRVYDGPVSIGTICTSIPASTPVVTDEWVAEGGTIEITTRAINTVTEATGASMINNFSHNIVFRNITFNRGNDEHQTTDQINFGTYTTPNRNKPVDFTALDNLRQCTTDAPLYKLSGNQVLSLNFDAATQDLLFPNQATIPGTPRQFYLNTAGQVTFKVYNNILTAENYCADNTGAVAESWASQVGIDGISGLIEVETTDAGNNNFIHKIHFKKVIFENPDGLTFTFGNDYVFGELITN